MKRVCNEVKPIQDYNVFGNIEAKFNMVFPNGMKEFFELNNGGIPVTKEICIKGNSYEIRYFLSFNENDFNSIMKPLETFQTMTKGKIVPFAKDSGDNYYCIHVETGKTYYWSHEDNLYYVLADSFEDFVRQLA